MNNYNSRIIPAINETTSKYFIDPTLVRPVLVSVSPSPFYKAGISTNYLAPGVIPNFLNLCLGDGVPPTVEIDPSTLVLKGVLLELKDFKGETLHANLELDIPFVRGRGDYHIVQRVECSRGTMFELTDNAGNLIPKVVQSIDLNLTFDRARSILKLNETETGKCKVVGFDVDGHWTDHNFSYTN